MNIEEIRQKFSKNISRSSVDEEQDVNSVKTVINKTNVVSGPTLRNIQSKTLNETKDFLSKTFGPMGSNTKIIKEVLPAYYGNIYGINTLVIGFIMK